MWTMQINCPSCDNTCEVEGEVTLGQHMVCPFCSEKFSYSGEQGNAYFPQTATSDDNIHSGFTTKCPIDAWKNKYGCGDLFK